MNDHSEKPELSFTFMDRSQWGDGDWQNEPDKVQFFDEESGYTCLIHRNYCGAWCGYVGIPESHPYFGKGRCDPPVFIHGGLTYDGLCQQQPHPYGVCHQAYPGQPERVWWFGFDCAHFGTDYIPSFTNEYLSMAEEIFKEFNELFSKLSMNNFFEQHGTYKNIAFVKAETKSLAQQLKQLETSIVSSPNSFSKN